MLAREVTAERVKRHFGDLVQGAVERYELPNLGALNFLLHGALGRRRHRLAAHRRPGQNFRRRPARSRNRSLNASPLTSHFDSSRMSTIGSIEARPGPDYHEARLQEAVFPYAE